MITFTFSMSVYTTDENSSVQVCVDLVEGQLTRPIEVMVQNAGGSATGECIATDLVTYQLQLKSYFKQFA